MVDANTLFQAMNGIHEEDVIMAGQIYLEKEQPKHKNTKRILMIALAAALTLALSIAAYAAGVVSSPKAAEKVALAELVKWQELGLLSEEVEADGDTAKVVDIRERAGGEYWFGRLFNHSYDVRFLGGEDNKYFLNLGVDTLTGKITSANIEAKAEETDAPVREVAGEQPADPEAPEGEYVPVTYYYYENFEDIFPGDMTVDRFCSLLAEYWGFTGYRLADTEEDVYYNAHWEAVDGASLLRDMPKDNYYLTIFFEGDQEGAPMYLQLSEFPGRVCLTLGTRHLIG